jgi:hypothetical protein
MANHLTLNAATRSFGMKTIAGIPFGLAGLTLMTLATDFWEDKPFSAWSEKEARRVLSDSPWSKTVRVPLSDGTTDLQRGKEPPSSLPPASPQPAGGAPDLRRNPSSSGGVPGTVGTGDAVGAGNGLWSAPFQVSWYSSSTVREAIGRLGQLQGNTSEEQLKAFVQGPVQDYVVAVSGPLMRPFEESGLADLKGKTFLISKRNKHKKLEVKEYVSPKDRKDGLALFLFPRTTEGQAQLDIGDEEVQFVSEVSGLKIKTVFKLSRMVVQGKLDI